MSTVLLHSPSLASSVTSKSRSLSTSSSYDHECLLTTVTVLEHQILSPSAASIFSSPFQFYVAPLLVVNSHLVLITLLHHTNAGLPHYDHTEWEWLKGALSTVDRDYGFLNPSKLHWHLHCRSNAQCGFEAPQDSVSSTTARQ